MNGLYDMMDMAIAEELGVDVKTYIRIIECECSNREANYIINVIMGGRDRIIECECSNREANYIINVIMGGREDKLENAKAMFNKYLEDDKKTNL
jgi:hypothetical protein